jgi:GTP cyclohydrolase I
MMAFYPFLEESMDDIRDGDCEPEFKEDPIEVRLAEQLFNRIIPGFTTAAEHSKETPKRFVKALKELVTRDSDWKFTTFPAESDNMIVLGPIPFYTLCAHHVVPFFGEAYIGYVPGEKIAGLSKFARTVEHCAKGLHVQETLTMEIATFLETALDPKGVAVVLQAEHMCMSMRGVRMSGVVTTTAEMRGVFGDHERTAKAEFLEWIR